MQMTRLCSIALAVVALGIVGCSSEIPTYPVSGTVTQGGSPVDGAAVTFLPDAGGDSAVGITDSSGKYALKTKTRDGAFAGAYKITIAKYEGGYDPNEVASEPAADPYDITNEYPDDYDEAKENAKGDKASTNLLPKRYASVATSELSATVAEEDNNFDFDLDKK